MPPARSGIRNLTEKYLERHPAEREQLKPLLAALEADAEPTSRAALPGHVTCSAVVIDRARRVLHIVHKASGKLLPPGGHVEDDRTLLAAALREVCEEAGIRPRDLCLIPQFLGAPIDVDVHDIDANPAKGELAHRHFDFRFAFYTTAEQTPPLVLQDEEVSGAQWLPFADVRSPTLRTKLLKAEADGLDGQPGIFTVYPPPDGDQATNTWSSGMSPAGFTSLGGAAVVEDPEGDVPEDPDEEEQATAPVTTTRPDTRADNVRRMENTSALAKEPTGMPPRPRRYEPGGQCQGPDELAGGQRAQPFGGPACGDTHRAADPPGSARYAPLSAEAGQRSSMRYGDMRARQSQDPSSEPDGATGDGDPFGSQRLRRGAGHDRRVRDAVPTAVARAVDGAIADPDDDAPLMGADGGETLELALLGLGHHDLLLLEDLAPSDRNV